METNNIQPTFLCLLKSSRILTLLNSKQPALVINWMSEDWCILWRGNVECCIKACVRNFGLTKNRATFIILVSSLFKFLVLLSQFTQRKSDYDECTSCLKRRLLWYLSSGCNSSEIRKIHWRTNHLLSNKTITEQCQSAYSYSFQWCLTPPGQSGSECSMYISDVSYELALIAGPVCAAIKKNK